MNSFAKFLIDNGGKEWQKAGKHRVYLSSAQISDAIGLSVSRYNTGNISSARLKGEKISNTQAEKIIKNFSFTFGKQAYYDILADSFSGPDDYIEEIETFLRKQYAAKGVF